MHINDYEVVCPLCSGFFSSPSCRLYNHPCPLKKDAAQREELALRLAEQRPLVIPLAPAVAQGPGPIEAAVARRVYSTHNASCKMEVATTAACILTLVGGRDGWDRLLKAPQIDAGEACSVCGHRVVIVGYRYQVCQQQQQQQQSGLDPRVTLCGPCGTWQLLWHRQAQAGAAAAAAEAAAAEGLAAAAVAEGVEAAEGLAAAAVAEEAAAEGLAAAAVAEGVEAAEGLAAAAAVAEGAATAVGVAAAQRHRGLALRSLVAQAQPGVSPVPVCALNLYQKPLVTEVLREATLPGQQARVTPLHAEKPTCVQLQAFLEWRGIADIHPAPLWSAVKGKRTAAQRDGVGTDGDGASAAGGPPVHDLETELKLFSAVTASERQKATALLAAAGERPTELMLEPDQTYHVLHTIPRSATASCG
ncbi:hypothetical protein CHLRE_10g455050v5 [Chlamydomonas reinhardtii]|uniref:Uncharacterized protein n=1 Tax=Chlamydomonas reinhardtii TaxID=3055 RepID=A0A2K3DBF9_CHLRE|nr:uncharacterized protein CHLRE_10g455050v5 [Chlamydomonas reinhardtii]PNW77870.1 hypothetical protein CHLRE_10g455050v5 [Chlamydomonas reinhardtii]